MKQYKHKKTGDIAELVNTSGYKLNKSTIGLIPIEYIENSSDWEEIRVKEVLFVTKDGVEIGPDDYYYYINYSFNISRHNTIKGVDYNKNLPQGSLVFSTNEKAQEYVLMNKPCLSYKDVLDTLFLSQNSPPMQRLQELVKSKL